MSDGISDIVNNLPSMPKNDQPAPKGNNSDFKVTASDGSVVTLGEDHK